MEVAMPMTSNAIDSYEDMFKEITRKLYGEDGLPELTQPPSMVHASSLTPIDYDVDTPPPPLKAEDHLTAFGLAALMQNGGFPSPFQQHHHHHHLHKPLAQNGGVGGGEDKWVISEDQLPWTQSKVASYNAAQKLFRCAECDCVGYLPRVAEHWLGTHSNLRVFQCPQCPYESAWARCVRMHLTRQHSIDTAEEASDAMLKNNAVLQEVTRYLQRLKTRLEANLPKTEEYATGNANTPTPGSTSGGGNRHGSAQSASNPETSPSGSSTTPSNKRYTCTYCPYATDRRDLFTRHENIHREEKPFQCYVCQKQFNRADHVKKHFLRMHREHVYDLNRIRRHPPKNASGMSYYQKYNNNTSADNTAAPTPAAVTSAAISIPNGFNSIARNAPPISSVGGNRHSETTSKAKSSKSGSSKKKGEKRFSCCYCSWSGVDNWCLKRHMNTHLKPFVCALCDYKAARSERLATHVLKVHNKRACSKCTFLADDQTQLSVHQQEHHPMEASRSARNSNSNNNHMRNNFSANGNAHKNHQDFTSNAHLHGHARHNLPPNNANEMKHWKPRHVQHGAARLFNYMEASDGSEPECDVTGRAEDMSRLSHRVQSDFPEAGDVGSRRTQYEDDVNNNVHDTDIDHDDDDELPIFVCAQCGCEFEDDASLEAHRITHRTTSPAKHKPPPRRKQAKNNALAGNKYTCKHCNSSFRSQTAIITHMASHSALYNDACDGPKQRSRKQSQPKKLMVHYTTAKGRKRARSASKKPFYCVKCHQVRTFATQQNYILHNYWTHSASERFQCEHCPLVFDHKYQMIIHASKVHVHPPFQQTPPPLQQPTQNQQEEYHQEKAIHPQTNEMSYTNGNELDNYSNLTHDTINVNKLGNYFDHHSSFNPSMLPLIIPTFPPN